MTVDALRKKKSFRENQDNDVGGTMQLQTTPTPEPQPGLLARMLLSRRPKPEPPEPANAREALEAVGLKVRSTEEVELEMAAFRQQVIVAHPARNPEYIRWRTFDLRDFVTEAHVPEEILEMARRGHEAIQAMARRRSGPKGRKSGSSGGAGSSGGGGGPKVKALDPDPYLVFIDPDTGEDLFVEGGRWDAAEDDYYL